MGLKSYNAQNIAILWKKMIICVLTFDIASVYRDFLGNVGGKSDLKI
jgi:hypothetical protein